MPSKNIPEGARWVQRAEIEAVVSQLRDENGAFVQATMSDLQALANDIAMMKESITFIMHVLNSSFEEEEEGQDEWSGGVREIVEEDETPEDTIIKTQTARRAREEATARRQEARESVRRQAERANEANEDDYFSERDPNSISAAEVAPEALEPE